MRFNSCSLNSHIILGEFVFPLALLLAIFLLGDGETAPHSRSLSKSTSSELSDTRFDLFSFLLSLLEWFNWAGFLECTFFRFFPFRKVCEHGSTIKTKFSSVHFTKQSYLPWFMLRKLRHDEYLDFNGVQI